MLLAAWAVAIVSWLGLAVLVALSIIWPANQLPHVLLGVWLCAIVAWPVTTVTFAVEGRLAAECLIEPVPGVFVSVSGALAEFLKAAFPGQGAGQVHPGGFMAEVSQHAHGIHPRRACPACRIEDHLPCVGIGCLEKFPKLLVAVTLN
jgi:hypothetical protein